MYTSVLVLCPALYPEPRWQRQFELLKLFGLRPSAILPARPAHIIAVVIPVR